jgi:hypothetical protein
MEHGGEEGRQWSGDYLGSCGSSQKKTVLWIRRPRGMYKVRGNDIRCGQLEEVLH